MSKTYQSNFTFDLIYQYPEKYLPSEDPPSKLAVALSGEGWKLLRKILEGKRDSIFIDVHGTSSHYVNAQDLSFKISNTIRSDEVSLAQIRQDGFNIILVPKVHITVPVHPDIRFDLPDQYGISDSLRLDPDSVTVTGPSTKLNEMQNWPTVSMNIGKIKGTFEKEIPLKSPESQLIQLQEHKTSMSLRTEAFTERSFFVSLKLDKPPDRSHLIFPEEVQVKFEVGMSRYDEIGPEDFEIKLKERETMDASSTYLVEIIDQPHGIRKLRYSPKEVELFYVAPDTTAIDQKDTLQ